MSLRDLARIAVDVAMKPDGAAKPRKGRGHSPGRSATERAALRRERTWRMIEKANPDLFLRLSILDLGLKIDEPAPAPDPFEQYLTMRKKMRDAGLENNGSGGDGLGGVLRDFIRELPAAAKILEQMTVQQAMARGQVVTVAPPAVVTPPAPSPAEPTANGAPADNDRAAALGKALYDAAYVRNPAEMADWLLHNRERYPDLKEFVPQFAAVPEEMIPAAIAQLRARPELRDFTDHLERNPDWTRDLLTEIKTRLAA